FVSETNEHELMSARKRPQTREEAGQQSRPAPIVDHSLTGVHKIKMGTDDDRVLDFTGHGTDHIGHFRVLDGLLGQARSAASCLLEKLFEFLLPCEIARLKCLEAAFDNRLG